MKKYKLTEEKIEFLGRTLYRIQALKDFSDVKKGDKGGFIEKESNLSQEHNARVSGNAWVYGDAMVYGDARVSGKTKISKGYVFAYLEKLTKFKTIKQKDGVLFITEFEKIKQRLKQK